MSYSSAMPRSFHSSPQFAPEISQSTATQIASLQAKLNKQLGPEYISQKPGPGGGPKLTYAEGWKIINLANEVFGFNGWSSSIISLSVDYIDQNDRNPECPRYNIGVTAIVRVTLRDGAFHEDVGYGMAENSKSKGGAIDKCKKEAVTDAIKRTLRNFGNLLGNCLYDKSYTQQVIKMKFPPARFDKDMLYRRPEFQESDRLNGSAPPTSSDSIPTENPPPNLNTSCSLPADAKPASALPLHMRERIPKQPLSHNGGNHIATKSPCVHLHKDPVNISKPLENVHVDTLCDDDDLFAMVDLEAFDFSDHLDGNAPILDGDRPIIFEEEKTSANLPRDEPLIKPTMPIVPNLEDSLKNARPETPKEFVQQKPSLLGDLQQQPDPIHQKQSYVPRQKQTPQIVKAIKMEPSRVPPLITNPQQPMEAIRSTVIAGPAEPQPRSSGCFKFPAGIEPPFQFQPSSCAQSIPGLKRTGRMMSELSEQFQGGILRRPLSDMGNRTNAKRLKR